MSIPRQASTSFLAALAVVCLCAALPLTASAQSAPAKQQSPNGKIVFQSTQGGDGFMNDIYVMDADGKHQTRLTDSPTFDDSSPMWSPGGDKVAFASDRGGSYDIYLMSADGSNQRPLRDAAHGGPFYGDGIEWSPDGTKLKFVNGGKIYVAEVVAPDGGDSTAPVQNLSASAPAGAFDSAASWSPDGQRLAFICTATVDGIPDLYVMNADGTGRTQLTFTPGAEANPSWSPVGAQIAYEAFRDGDRHIYVIGPDGTGDVKVSGSAGAFGGAAWAPDGTRLAFVSAAGNVYAASPDGSGPVLLSDVTATSSVFWSPDGAKVAFHNSNGSFIDLYTVNSDGSRKATNYTKTRRDDEFSHSWQRLQTQ